MPLKSSSKNAAGWYLRRVVRSKRSVWGYPGKINLRSFLFDVTEMATFNQLAKKQGKPISDMRRQQATGFKFPNLSSGLNEIANGTTERHYSGTHHSYVCCRFHMKVENFPINLHSNSESKCFSLWVVGESMYISCFLWLFLLVFDHSTLSCSHCFSYPQSDTLLCSTGLWNCRGHNGSGVPTF